MKFQNWLGQATTGVGFSTILTGIGVAGSGVLSWKQAVPMLAGGVASLVWPENNVARQVAQQMVYSTEKLLVSAQGSGLGETPDSGATSAPHSR